MSDAGIAAQLDDLHSVLTENNYVVCDARTAYSVHSVTDEWSETLRLFEKQSKEKKIVANNTSLTKALIKPNQMGKM